MKITRNGGALRKKPQGNGFFVKGGSLYLSEEQEHFNIFSPMNYIFFHFIQRQKYCRAQVYQHEREPAQGPVCFKTVILRFVI